MMNYLRMRKRGVSVEWISYDSLYSVSSDGHIKNVKRNLVLREYVGKDGYLRTQLHGKTFVVHRIVAKMFIPNPQGLPEVNHKDGNKQNNSVENLEWVTRSDNLRHAYKTGLKNAKGTKNSRSILTENDVEYIKSNYKKGDATFGAKALAKKYGVAHQTICAVAHGQNWS